MVFVQVDDIGQGLFDSSRVGLNHFAFAVNSHTELQTIAKKMQEVGFFGKSNQDLSLLDASEECIYSLKDPNRIIVEIVASHIR